MHLESCWSLNPHILILQHELYQKQTSHTPHWWQLMILCKNESESIQPWRTDAVRWGSRAEITLRYDTYLNCLLLVVFKFFHCSVKESFYYSGRQQTVDLILLFFSWRLTKYCRCPGLIIDSNRFSCKIFVWNFSLFIVPQIVNILSQRHYTCHILKLG